jgi:hypothetical protein
MGQMQDKIIAELRRIAEAAGLQLIDQPQYANTGTAYIQSGFDTVAEVSYAFHDTSCRITLHGDVLAAVPLPASAPPRREAAGELTWYSLAYRNGEEIRKMLAITEAALAGAGSRDAPAAMAGP